MNNQIEIEEAIRENNFKRETERNFKEIGIGSQAGKILAYLKAGNNLTGLQALDLFQTMKLASRISELRRMGHDIQDEFIYTTTGKMVKRYWMVV